MRKNIQRTLILICVLLLLGSVIAQTAHRHDNSSDELSCAVCITSHTITIISVSFIGFILLIALVERPLAFAAGEAKFERWFELVVRPPPAG